VVGSTTLTFTPTITDQDGDTAQASSDLSISLVGTTNNSNGYTETGTDTTAEVVVASANADVLSGGSGSGDTVDYSNSTAGVSVNLATNTVSSGWATGDTISGFENAVGSSFADTLTATNTGSTLDGGANSTGGTDVLNGGSGNDILIASRAGTDSLTGNGGSDTFVLHAAGGANVTINDFNLLANDQLIVDIGQGLTFTTAAALDASNFHTGDETNVATWNGGTGKEFTYNSATGELWYSANGTGSDKIDLAHLSTGLPMTAANIHTV
jgi:Ca2+-binding RTX toxin-like protein